MKYSELQTAVFSIFASSAWEAESINTYPSNFVAMDTTDEFIRVTIVPSGAGVNLLSVSGIIIIDIFTPAGKGPQRQALIADSLDSYLVGKSIDTASGVVQCFQSATEERGRDSSGPSGKEGNDSLHRTIYSIPFNFNGVV